MGMLTTYDKVVLLVVVVNALFVLLFAVQKNPKEHRAFALFFLLVPVLGFAIYYLPKLLYRVSKQHNHYDASNVILHAQSEEIVHRPNMEEEINVISIDEAMSSCTPQEKRALLLNILKNDMIKNAAVIKSALNDSDSEMAHYAASATLETYKKLKASIQEREALLSVDSKDTALIRDYITALWDCIESGVLTTRDYSFYMMKYVQTINNCIADVPEILTCEDYIRQADCSLRLNDSGTALATAYGAAKRFHEEDAYMKGLEICFKTKNQKRFEEIFSAMKASGIPLSNRAVELIRFWNLRCD
ncbi:MAG: hypothetical protein RSF82_11140 [Angelakisella sp.]